MRYKRNDNNNYGVSSPFKKKAEDLRFSMPDTPPDNNSKEITEDNELISRFLGGDKEAFTLLMRKYEKNIYAFVLSYVKNKYDAEDITQDTFIRAYKYLDTFSYRSSFTTWLHTIAKNLSLTFLEQEKRRSSMMTYTVKYDDDTKEKDPLEDATTGETAEDSVMKKELYKVMLAEIDKLPDEYRDVIILREVNRLSYEKIAEILDINMGTVKSRISRARNILRNAVSDYI